MEFIIALALGAAAGAGVMYVKNSSQTKDSDLAQREVEKENAELQQEITDLKRKASSKGDETMDLEDDLDEAKRKVSKQEREIEQLKRSLDEYKGALQACELELESLKNKD